MIHHGRTMMAIARPQNGAGGVSAPPALRALPTSRTITDGFPGHAEAGDVKAA
jgi:hypothetical protein